MAVVLGGGGGSQQKNPNQNPTNQPTNQSGGEAAATEGNGGEHSYHFYTGNTDPTS